MVQIDCSIVPLKRSNLLVNNFPNIREFLILGRSTQQHSTTPTNMYAQGGQADGGNLLQVACQLLGRLRQRVPLLAELNLHPQHVAL